MCRLKSGHDFLSFLSDMDQLQLVLVACPDGVVATDEENRIILYTGASEQIFGFAPYEVMGRDLGVLFAIETDYDELRERLGEAGQVVSFEMLALRREAEPFPAAVSAAALHDRYGSNLGIVAYVRDHTEARSAQETLRANYEQLGALVVELDHVARHDQLTGLLYRASAIEAAEELLAHVAPGAPLSVAIFDLDRFKFINDTFGHLVGDQVLATLASVLRRTARERDIIGRFGGEEFIAFLPGAGLAQARAFAERVCNAIADAELPLGAELQIRVTASAGVAAMPSCADSLNEAILAADDRLYIAKRSGRNQVVAGGGNKSGRHAA